MKIGFVLDDSLDKSDGVQQYLLTLGKWMKRHGNDVHYLVGQTERKDIPNVHSLSRNIQVHFNQNRMTTPLPASRQPIEALLAREKFDVLHIQLPYSPFLAGRIINSADPKTAIIGTFHIIPFSRFEQLATKVLSIWLWRNKRKFDHVFSVSLPAADFARRSFGIKTTILPNVVDVSLYGSAKPYRKYDDGLVNVLFLGRLVERKGCLYFLKAIQELHTSGRLDGVRVLIAGKGPLEPELHEYVIKNHLKRHVKFLGYVSEDDKARYLKTAHIAVFPSTGGESFGIVLIEAMAAGKPVVIAGNNIGYRSVLGERPGQIVSPKNTAEFAKTLHRFIANEPARRKSHQWQQNVIKNYDVHKVGLELIDRYDAALQQKLKMR